MAIKRQKLWIIGRCICPGVKGRGWVWEFQGIVDTEEKADHACIDAMWFYAPAKLNSILPKRSSEWKGVRHPRTYDPLPRKRGSKRATNCIKKTVDTKVE